MTVTLPTSWGPGTILAILLVLVIAIGGIVQVIMGDLSWDGYMELMTHPGIGIIVGGLVIGRGIAYGGPGTGMKTTPDEPTGDVRR